MLTEHLPSATSHHHTNRVHTHLTTSIRPPNILWIIVERSVRYRPSLIWCIQEHSNPIRETEKDTKGKLQPLAHTAIAKIKHNLTPSKIKINLHTNFPYFLSPNTTCPVVDKIITSQNLKARKCATWREKPFGRARFRYDIEVEIIKCNFK